MRIFYGHRPTSSATHYRIDGGGTWCTKIVGLVWWTGPGWHCSVFRGPRGRARAATCSSSGLRGDRRWSLSHAWIGYSLSGSRYHHHDARRSRERARQEWFFCPEWRIRVCPPRGCRRLTLAFTGPGSLSLDALLGHYLSGIFWGVAALMIGIIGAVVPLMQRRRVSTQ